jgi:hypothetical protein
MAFVNETHKKTPLHEQLFSSPSLSKQYDRKMNCHETAKFNGGGVGGDATIFLTNKETTEIKEYFCVKTNRKQQPQNNVCVCVYIHLAWGKTQQSLATYYPKVQGIKKKVEMAYTEHCVKLCIGVFWSIPHKTQAFMCDYKSRQTCT